MVHQKLSSAVKYAQRLADKHRMRYTVTQAAPSLYRVRLGVAHSGAPFSIIVNPRG